MPRKKQQPEDESGRADNGDSSVYFSEKDGHWHGWVTVGVKDNGSPDRRHRMSKNEKKVRDGVRELEKQRDAGTVGKAGPAWTVEKWLIHWVENISAPTVRDSTADSYRNAVYNHLVPGVGKHQLARIQPDHFEKLYAKMQAAGHKPGNAHQVHRTAKVAFGEAVRRGHLGRNPVSLAKPPRMEDEEIEPYELDEVQKILAAAAKRRNSSRWAIALVLGLRQGEVLGLRWTDLDLTLGTLRVRENRLRPKYAHGCGEAPCGRKAGYCPQKVNTRKLTGPVKSRAGKRPMGVPAPLLALLTAQKVAQDAERAKAGDLWQNGDWVFATETGAPLNPNTDFHDWKDLIKEAGVRDARLHDARHTAATLLLILGSEGRTTQGLMGWSDPSMPARYQHLVKQVQTDIAKRQGDLVWGVPTTPGNGPTATETATGEGE